MLDEIRVAILAAKASTLYVTAGAILGGAFLLGLWAGTQTRAELCAEDIIEAETQRDRASALNQRLTACEAQCSANCAIDCEAACADQVNSALENARAWSCQ